MEEEKMSRRKGKKMGEKTEKMPDSSAYAALLHDNFIYKKFWLGNLIGTYEFGHGLKTEGEQ
jgi:hypothetical protein